ncbi:MAG TPA: hypothetical protein VG101_09005 [Puia sp.]|jgi:hypothetical protein|nr:hypothetical protein [Puia sp.]
MNKKITIVAFLFLLLAGCVTTTVNVTDRKPVARPFSRILCFYLDEGCDFSLFDSTLYNICLRNHTLRDSGYVHRSDQEAVIAERLSTGGTSVWVSSYLLDSAHTSYAGFLRYIDSMKVDGLLIVGVRGYEHVEHQEVLPVVPSTPNNPVMGGVTHTYTTLNGTFLCDLFSTQSLIRPVWRAEIGEKGRRENTKKGLTSKLLQQVVESLKNSQYIAH